MLYPMQKKHQNMCYQTIMMPLAPQNMGFYYDQTTKYLYCAQIAP